jgi:hypothetical protein
LGSLGKGILEKIFCKENSSIIIKKQSVIPEPEFPLLNKKISYISWEEYLRVLMDVGKLLG